MSTPKKPKPRKRAKLSELNSALSRLRVAQKNVDELSDVLHGHDSRIAGLQAQAFEREKTITELKAEIYERDKKLAETNRIYGEIGDRLAQHRAVTNLIEKSCVARLLLRGLWLAAFKANRYAGTVKISPNSSGSATVSSSSGSSVTLTVGPGGIGQTGQNLSGETCL